MITLPKIIEDINNEICKNNAKLYVVGGFVRDYYLNKNSSDIDLEVFKMDSKKLTSILENFGLVKIRKNFGVHELIIDDNTYQFTIARTEVKTGNKHTDFEVDINPNLTIKEASLRRDFTMNSLYYDIETKEVIDLHNGLNDIKNKVIRHINDKTFKDDPLRILRALRFSTNLNFSIHENTINYCLDIIEELQYISSERKDSEFKSIILGEYFIEKIEYMRIILFKYFSFKLDYTYNLDNINKYQQNLKFHPEGDVWTHTILTLKAYEKIDFTNCDKFIIRTSLLLHDIGKVKDTYIKDDWISNKGHELSSYEFSKSFIVEFVNNKSKQNLILHLVKDHMIPFKVKNINIKLVVDYLQYYKENYVYLLLVALCDKCGRDNVEYFNTKFSFLYDNMYVKGIKLYEYYVDLKKQYNGNYYLNKNIHPKNIGSMQKKDIAKQLENFLHSLD